MKRIAPDRAKIRTHKRLRLFGDLLQDPNLWHLNRKSVSGAVAVGLFVMYLPPLGQMLIAAAAAITLRVNLPISVALVWVTNPITIPPMYYFAYLVGTWVLGTPALTFDARFWLDWDNWLSLVGPLSIGCLVCGTLCSALGYLAVQGFWRWNLVRQIRLRRVRYRSLSAGTNRPSSKRQT